MLDDDLRVALVVVVSENALLGVFLFEIRIRYLVLLLNSDFRFILSQ